MKIILAQGNPEKRFDHTRHNVGFALIDHFVNSKEGKDWQEKPKFNGLISEFQNDTEKILLVKPLTYYNDTGLTAHSLIDFYKVNTSDVLVIHDDLALPFGTLRTRSQGSDAGNNGIKSINSHIGENYKRIRVGIWNEQRNIMNDADFVLGKFSLTEEEQLKSLIAPQVDHYIDEFIKNSLSDTSIVIPLD